MQIPSAIAQESGDTVENRIKELISHLTLEEKIDMLYGRGSDTKQIKRLGIPSIKATDGPVGINWQKSTCFPASIAMAATWDTALIEKTGRAMGLEARAKRRNLHLAPCINIARVPHGGRNFESFGEDPWLVSRMAVAYVRGVQSQGVMSCPKHYACNNQEYERGSINVIVDERTLNEIYFPAFKACIQEAGAWSIMAAYNKVNGYHCTENRYLLTEILKDRWGFKGFVLSDWGATHSTVPAANAGLDLEMPAGEFFGGNKLLNAVRDNRVSEDIINDKVSRILRALICTGQMDNPERVSLRTVNCDEHKALALEVARQGIVLLKNKDSILPLKREKIKSIAVIGPSAAIARYGGGGSSHLNPYYSISPLKGIQDKVSDKIAIYYAQGSSLTGEIVIDSEYLITSDTESVRHGLKAEFFPNKNLSGKPVYTRVDPIIDFDWGGGGPRSGWRADEFSIRWTGKLIAPGTGKYEIGVVSDDGIRLYLNGNLLIDDWVDHGAAKRTATLELEKGNMYDICLEYYENQGVASIRLIWDGPGLNPVAEAVEAAKKSEVVLLFCGTSDGIESEGFDRENLELPECQEKLIDAILSANKNTILVLNTGGPILMEKWIDRVPAIVEAWFPGEQCGNAIADILFGDVNPSGKLPVTFPKRWEDCPAYGNYPGKNGRVEYAEGIFVGYRYFDTEDIEPLFPFGHGLSYTSFEYSNLKINPEIISTITSPEITVYVSLDLQNTGEVEGAEVVQLYVRDVDASVPRPLKELKRFKKVNLKPGEKTKIEFTLDRNCLAFYSPEKKDWVVEPGEFEVLVGSSSRDIRLKGSFCLK